MSYTFTSLTEHGPVIEPEDPCSGGPTIVARIEELCTQQQTAILLSIFFATQRQPVISIASGAFCVYSGTGGRRAVMDPVAKETFMLHMVVLTHGPDTCAGVSPESAELLRKARSEMTAASEKLGVKVQSWWVDPPAHIFYMVADAANAHVVSNLMTELQLFHWNTVDIHPIVTADDAMPLVAE